MVEIKELLKKRELLYNQIRDINNEIEKCCYNESIVKVGDLYYDNEGYYYLIIGKNYTSVTVISYCKNKYNCELNTSIVTYTNLWNFQKVTSDKNILEEITEYLLKIKNGKEL